MSTVDGGPPVTTSTTFGATHSGSYHLGPVDWAQTQWTNACGPYPTSVQTMEGVYLAGVDNSLASDGSLCDACALVTTRLGKSVLVRLITYGVSNTAGDMDLSPEAYAAIHEDDPQGTSSNPRPMSWQLARCAGGSSASLALQWQTQANPYWTSFWVRNAALPLAKVEVKSSKHAAFFALRRETDGTWNDDGGFGEGAFTLRFTATTGEVVTADFTTFTAGATESTSVQF